jgi:hypothetical protein
MSLSLFSNWGIGVLNGFNYKEDGISSKIKYTAMSVSSVLFGLRAFSVENIPKLTPQQMLAVLFIGTPLAIGSSFCMGTQFGKALRDVEDRQSHGPGRIKLKLL